MPFRHQFKIFIKGGYHDYWRHWKWQIKLTICYPELNDS